MSLRVLSPIVAIYVCGLVAAQIHRLDQGITEIAALDTYYLLTGMAFIICLLPAILFIMASELLLAAWAGAAELRVIAKKSENARRSYVRAVAQPILLLSFCAIATAWFAIQRADDTFFDFRMYDAPKYYVYWNITALNVGLICFWLTLLLLVRLQVTSIQTLRRFLFVPAFILAVFLVYWSKTIYPAIDPSLGGAAPKLAFVQATEGSPQPAMLLLSSEQGIYYHALGRVPDLGKVLRGEPYWWSLPKDDPLVVTRLQNHVFFLPKTALRRLEIVADDLTRRYDKIREAER